MKDSIRKILAVVIAIYFTGISLGFSLDVHYCGGKVADVSLLGKASCSHNENKHCDSGHCHIITNSMTSKCSMQKGSCCANKTINLQFRSHKAVAPERVKIAIANMINLLLIVDLPLENKRKEKDIIPDDFVLKESHSPPYILFQRLLFYH